MKRNTFFSILFFIILFFNNNAYSQTIDYSINEEIVKPVKHWVKQVDGKNYILWTIIEQHENCVYLVERSTNSTDWEMIGFKDGYKSPNNVALAYYYTDEYPSSISANLYRLKRVVLKKDECPEANRISTFSVKEN